MLYDQLLDIEAHIAPYRGGELTYLRTGAIQLIHRADDFADAAGKWVGRAPVLFPAVGRQANAKYTFDGVTREMPLHGFAQECAFQPVDFWTTENDANCIVALTNKDVPERFAASYPFAFELQLHYKLSDGRLTLEHTITNKDTASPLPFAIGNHITFAFPFTAAGSWSGGRLVSPDLTHEYLLAPGSLLSGETRPEPAFQPSAGGLRLDAPCATNGVFGFAPDAHGHAASSAPTDGGAASGSAPSSSGSGGRQCTLTLRQEGELAVHLSHDIQLDITASPAAATTTDAAGSASAPAIMSPHSTASAPAASAAVPIAGTTASSGTGGDTAISTDTSSSASASLCDWDAVSQNLHFVLWGEPPVAPPSPASLSAAESEAGASTAAASGTEGCATDSTGDDSSTPSPTGSSGASTGDKGFARGFICPEPWVTGPDSLNTRKGLPILAPGQAAVWTVRIQLEPLTQASKPVASASAGASASGSS